jgi:hypothetical protein
MYDGPEPKSINIKFPDHCYDLITCLVNGEQKKIIQNRYLQKLGYTKEQYIGEFPDAPLKSKAASDSYRKAALSDTGKLTRSNNITILNLYNTEFQKKRKVGVSNFLDSDRSISYRKTASDRTKEQHKNGHAEHIRKYFNERFDGSIDQTNRSIRAKNNNPLNYPGAREKSNQTWLKNYKENKHFKKKLFKSSGLSYQSSLELQFLEFMERQNFLQYVSKAPTLKDQLYPRRWYVPDFLLFGTYIVEIKSWYIEKKQLELNPQVTNEKQSLVIRSGYQWLYIKDNEYSELISIISSRS